MPATNPWIGGLSLGLLLCACSSPSTLGPEPQDDPPAIPATTDDLKGSKPLPPALAAKPTAAKKPSFQPKPDGGEDNPTLEADSEEASPEEASPEEASPLADPKPHAADPDVHGSILPPAPLPTKTTDQPQTAEATPLPTQPSVVLKRTIELNFATLTIPESWQRSPDETGDAHIALRPVDRATGVRLDIFRDASPVRADAQLAYLDAYQERLKAAADAEGLNLSVSREAGFDLLRVFEVYKDNPSEPGTRSGLWQIHRVIFGKVANWTFVLTTRDESATEDRAFLQSLLAGEDGEPNFVPKAESIEKSSRASRLDLRFGVPEGWGSEIQRNDVVRLTAPVTPKDIKRHQTITIAALGQRIVGLDAHRRFARRVQSELAAEHGLELDEVTVQESAIVGFTRIDIEFQRDGRVERRIIVFGNRRTHVFTLDARSEDAEAMIEALDLCLTFFSER